MDMERIGLSRALTTMMILSMLMICVDQEEDFAVPMAMNDEFPVPPSDPLDAFMPPMIPPPSGIQLRLPSERSLPVETPLHLRTLSFPSENPVDPDPVPATPLPPDTLTRPPFETPQAPPSPSPSPSKQSPPPSPSPPPDPIAIACDNECILKCQDARGVKYVYDLCFRMCRVKCITALKRLIDNCAVHCARPRPMPAVVVPDTKKEKKRLLSCIGKCLKRRH